MGRGYIVDDSVEGYLSRLCEQHAAPVPGLLIGQNSVQRDFIIMAIRTPQREESTASSRSSLDKEWVTEHARQVSRMLPGGLAVLGVFIIDDNDAKDALVTLQHLVFAVENLVSSEYLWCPKDDDVTDRVTLHINPKTRKTVCRTVDVRDQKSTTKPADWRYQSNMCSSWSTVSCRLNVDLLLPIPDNTTSSVSAMKHLKDELKLWAHQIDAGDFLIGGQKLPEDTELAAGQKKNVPQEFTAQLLVTPVECSKDSTESCGGSMSVSGAIHCTAYLHSNKLKVRLAEKALKRDVVSSVTLRVQMLLEDLEDNSSGGFKTKTEQLLLPCRVYCPVERSSPVNVCDYRFSDEGLFEVTDRLKEMLDLDVAEEDLDITQETPSELIKSDVESEPAVETTDTVMPTRNPLLGVVMATAVALLATAASVLYLSDV